MTQKKSVFVLGSGFSKSFAQHMPTMPDLTDRLFQLKNPSYENLTGFVQDLYAKSNKLKDIRNIENIATIIFSKQIFKDFEEKMDYEKLKFELLKFIYNEIQHPRVNEKKKNTLYDFLKYCAFRPPRDNQRFSIFSFNYDLILEDVLKVKNDQDSEDIEINYGLKFERYENQVGFTAEKDSDYQVELLKLHGSFNWFRAKGSESNDIRNIYLVDDTERMYSIHVKDIPTYIPMSDVKPLFLRGTLYNTLWAKAIDQLNKCDEIYFIGYGFPQTDLNDLDLWLEYKEKIKYINIEEKGEGEKLSRLTTLFGEDRIVNMDAKKFIEEKILSSVTA